MYEHSQIYVRIITPTKVRFAGPFTHYTAAYNYAQTNVSTLIASWSYVLLPKPNTTSNGRQAILIELEEF